MHFMIQALIGTLLGVIALSLEAEIVRPDVEHEIEKYVVPRKDGEPDHGTCYYNSKPSSLFF